MQLFFKKPGEKEVTTRNFLVKIERFHVGLQQVVLAVK